MATGPTAPPATGEIALLPVSGVAVRETDRAAVAESPGPHPCAKSLR